MEETAAIILPPPNHKGELSLEQTIFRRQSERTYADSPLTVTEVSQMIWAAAGKNIDAVTGPTRTFPSAGGLYPQKFYLVVNNVENLANGIYSYKWKDHALEPIKKGEYGQELADAALGQRAIARAPLNIVTTAVPERTTQKYGRRGERYVMIDAGFSGQNIYLQAESLGLATVTMGAFSEKELSALLDLDSGEIPLLIMPVGKKE
ncbi:MAG: SagB/ThcOx family dehydrogenase [Candidatus Omnitrophica bacterium]|nr:SagB/ThcOx family dehydrogenase [Candidatus Omnitrophota bacterium]